jgi:hypothetical protein
LPGPLRTRGTTRGRLPPEYAARHYVMALHVMTMHLRGNRTILSAS